MKYCHLLISTTKALTLRVSTRVPYLDIMKKIVMLRWRLIFVTSTWRIDWHPVKQAVK